LHLKCNKLQGCPAAVENFSFVCILKSFRFKRVAVQASQNLHGTRIAITVHALPRYSDQGRNARDLASGPGLRGRIREFNLLPYDR